MPKGEAKGQASGRESHPLRARQLLEGEVVFLTGGDQPGSYPLVHGDCRYEDFYELVCERYRRGSLMVVSNRAPKDWYALFPNPVLAEGSLDRFINSSHHVFMVGKRINPRRLDICTRH